MPVTLRSRAGRRAGRFLLLEVMNIRRVGPGIMLAPRADPSDGWLDVVAVAARERERLTDILERCLAVRPPRPFLRSQKVRRIRLAVQGGEFRLDDRILLPRGRAAAAPARIDIEVQPGAIELLLPGPGPATRRPA